MKLVPLLTTLFATTALAQTTPNLDSSLEAFVQGFKGKDALNDGSKPLAPEETLQHFKIAPGWKLELVASEPTVSQPLNLHFDQRGRLWIPQHPRTP